MAKLRARATQELVSGAVNGDLELVRDALARGGDPQVAGPWSLVGVAAWRDHHHLLSCLLEAGLSPEGRNTDPWTPLMLAARQGHKGTMKALLAEGANPEATDSDGWTALHHAARRGHVEGVKTLAGVTRLIPFGEAATTTPQHLACREGHLSVVKVLQAAGWPLHTSDSDGQTLLHFAAWRGSVEVVQHLVEARVHPLLQDSHGWTALHWAAWGCSVAVFQHLVQAGVDPLLQDHDGRTALDIARQHGLIDTQLISVVQEHVRARRDVPHVNDTVYLYSVRWQRGWHEELHRHIVSCMEDDLYEPHFLNNLPVNALDSDGLTLLHHAAQCRGATAWVKALLERGANPHVMTPDSMTPADLARRGGHTEVLEALSLHQCGKDDTPRDQLYHQLLSTIGREDDVRKVSSLLCHGAPLQPLDSGSLLDLECGSIQALRLAVLSDRRGTVILLLASGAELPASLLQEAWQSHDVNEEVLVDLTTAYWCGLRAERRRARPNGRLVQGIDHLLEAIEGDAPWAAAWPSKSPQEFSLLLGEAARHDCPLTAGFLSLAGAWPFLSGAWGPSALHVALQAGKSSMADVLVRDLGGCLYIPDAARRLPRDLLPAAERRRLEELQFLKERSKLQDLDILQHVGHRQLTARQALAVQEELYECYVAGRSPAGLSPAGHHRIALLLAARRGLPQLTFLVLQVGRFSCERVVDHECGTTALHEAAAHGLGACVALLLCQGAERQSRDKYGQTPCHLAAMFGHKNMRHLLEDCAPLDRLTCRAGTTPEKVSHNFVAYLETCENRCSKVRKSLTDCYYHPRQFANKCKQGILLSTLEDEAERALVDFSRGKARKVKEAVMTELRAIMYKVGCADAMYRGKLILVGSSRDGSKLYAPDEFDVNVVIKVDNVTVSVEETERLLAPRKGRKKLSVSGDNPGLEGDKFVTKFFSLVQETLAEHQLQDTRLSLVPPGLTRTQVGVALALAWQGREYPLLLVSIDFMPVLEVPWHQEVARPWLTPQGSSPVMHLSNTAEGSWQCSFAQMEAAVLEQLHSSERRIYMMGKTLLCCDKEEQWMPQLNSYTYNTWRFSGHWKSRVPNGFSYKNAFLRWLEQQRREDAGQEEDPAKVLVEIFRQMCVNPEAAPQDLQASSSPAYFGGDCEAPKSGKGAPFIVQWLEGALVKGTTEDCEAPQPWEGTPRGSVRKGQRGGGLRTGIRSITEWLGNWLSK